MGKTTSDVRKRAQQVANQNKKKKKEKQGIKEYFKGVKLEMKKVVWPTKHEMKTYTITVLLTCAAFALAFWAIDTGVLAALKGLLGISM